MIEFAVHDTFDCLSPRFDSPMSVEKMRTIARRHLRMDFEVVEVGVTLLRTKLYF